ncbi:MAG: hypothetical protein PHE68_00110 [Candidatus Peribacteraceae bacterium]|nr:hypothetical protein [Candidatus Peribacteraceae bacterium]MDD5075239.1 hypothetical protein [Candidatus Peribacteraceae bacterium]
MDAENNPSAASRLHDVFHNASCDISVKCAVYKTLADLVWLLVMLYDRDYPDCPCTTYNVVGLSPKFHRLVGSTYPSFEMSYLDSYLHSKGTQRDDVMRRVDHDVDVIEQRCIDVLEGRTTLDRLECMLDQDGA